MHTLPDLPPTAAPTRRGWLKGLAAALTGGLLLGRRPARATPPQPLSTNGNSPFLGEIMLVAFNFAPQGWRLCDGSTLSINQNQALFALLGTRYGGNGTTTFALPDLRGRLVVGPGTGYPLGQSLGNETVTLTAAQTAHQHGVQVSTDLGTTELAGIGGTTHHYLADSGGGAPQFTTTDPTGALAVTGQNAAVVNTSSAAGSGQPHDNVQPILTLNFVIAVQGIFPSTT